MREMWFALLGAVALFAASPNVAQPATPPAGSAESALTITPDDRILGNKDAPITIVEYASLTCPHCAHFTVDVLPKLKAKWIDTGKAKLILRDFPLDEPAMRAAMVARCAPPDRFYAFADAFFSSQASWVMSKDYHESLARMARLGGMGQKEFDGCINNAALENQVAGSRLVAEKQLGVDATPTFFINGTKYTGEPTVEGFDRLLSGLAAKS